MRTASKLLSLGTIMGLLVAMTVVMHSETAQARPNYKKALTTAYPDNATVKKIGCMNCHPKKESGKGANAKKRNPFGVAVGKALGAKKVKDKEKIAEALTKAAAEKSAVEGKTFGELIADGLAPFTAE